MDFMGMNGFNRVFTPIITTRLAKDNNNMLQVCAGAISAIGILFFAVAAIL